MLELICDQSYTWTGVPADKSPYKNHGRGINTDGADDGFAPGSGVIRFPLPDSRVRIDQGPAWQSLISLKIEVVAKVDPTVKPFSVLVAGDQSFRFGISEGALEAEFNNGTSRDNYVRAADAFAPDHKYHRIPTNRWVTLGFHHDGYARMRLLLDGALVGEAVIQGSIKPVQALGVTIGNGVDVNGLQFPGDIDEVRIWRLDPHGMKREFLGRPHNSATAECWDRFVKAVLKWSNENPDQFRALVHPPQGQTDAYLRMLFLLPDRDQARVRALLAAITDLWYAGNIAGPQMEKLLCDLIATLRGLGIDPTQAIPPETFPAVILESRKELLECDEQIAKFIELIHKAEANCGKNREVTA